MNKNRTLYEPMANSTNATFQEDTMKKQNTEYKNGTKSPSQVSRALRDGLITLAGLGIAAGSVLNKEITMWWMGA